MGSVTAEKIEKWVLCHNEEDVFHIVRLTVGSTVESGQPIMEEFDTESEIRERVLELTKDEKFFDNVINPAQPVMPEESVTEL